MLPGDVFIVGEIVSAYNFGLYMQIIGFIALSKADICKILPDVSPTTVEAVLGAMVRTGSVKRIGAGRATRYIRG